MIGKIMLSLLFILGYFVGVWLVKEQFEKDVEKMFLAAGPAQPNTFQLTQLSGLPIPVQPYFRHILRPGQSYLLSVKMTHDGYFKTDLKKNWTRIRSPTSYRVVKNNVWQLQGQ